MNYFYDVLINLNDDRVFKFYEWNRDDPIIHLKKIPIIKINTAIFKTIAEYSIKVNRYFLDSIFLTTEYYEKKLTNIEYMALFTDTKNAIVLEFNKNGESIARSSLLLEAELDLLEISQSLKRTNLDFKKLNKINMSHGIRQLEDLNRVLEIEINTLYEMKNKSKLRYLYNEITGKDEDNIEVLYKAFLNILQSDFNDNHFKLYNIIKLSYKRLST